MKSLAKILELVCEEDGPTAVEYAVLLASIIIVCMGAIYALSDATIGVWNRNTDALRDHQFIE